jgi:XTP/dITP diphosphohydrolase
MDLLIATQNPGKMREFRELLAPLHVALQFPPALGLALDVVEDGETYLANARLKATAYAQASGLIALADDSGLEVDALDGAPGIRSARYMAGSDTDRVTKLLRNLQGIPDEERTARFRCLLLVCSSEDTLLTAEGVCEGLITQRPIGAEGFGYDPIFWLPDHGCTMAQLSAEEKNRISHRARAVQAALPGLRHVFQRLASPLDADSR